MPYDRDSSEILGVNGSQDGPDWSHVTDFSHEYNLNEKVLIGPPLLKPILRKLKSYFAFKNRNNSEVKRKRKCHVQYVRSFDCPLPPILKEENVDRYLTYVRHDGDLRGKFHCAYISLLERCGKFLFVKPGG